MGIFTMEFGDDMTIDLRAEYSLAIYVSTCVARSERLEVYVRANILVINRPETMKTENILVVVADVFHFVPVLISDAVIYGVEFDFGEEFC